MKRIFTLIIGCLLALSAFAQFGGGSGTESDPYRIYTIEHWNEFATEYNDSLSVYGDFSGIHLRLMNDMTDTITTRLVGFIGSIYGEYSYKRFNGYLHGGGHTLILSMPEYEIPSYQENPRSFLEMVGDAGAIDSIDFRGKINSKCMSEIIEDNYGHISYCTMDFDCSAFTPDDEYLGMFFYNQGTVEYVKNYTEIPMGGAFFGIGFENHEGGVVSHCINYADLNLKDETFWAAGILYDNIFGIVEYCMNVGNMNNVKCEVSGILLQNDAYVYEVYDYENHEMVVDTIVRGIVRNCINLGNIHSAETNAALKSMLVCENSGGIITNCFNAGNATGNVIDLNNETDTMPLAVIEITHNSLFSDYLNSTTENCLNIGNTSGVFINIIENPNDLILRNNYYDKQMNGGMGSDTIGAIEGRLTSQLTGDAPELRAMLGEDWSYAEGRYPVPLGFENDSIVLRAATPIFLHAESENNYEHIDSVASHFSVSIANGAQWLATSGKIDIVGENATLLHLGRETLKTNLGDLYEKNITLNIVNVPVVAETYDMQNISIFPNPTNDVLNITSSETISEIEIVNVMGQVVKRIEVNSDNAVCDVEDLKAGVYVVKVERLNGETEELKMVKE